MFEVSNAGGFFMSKFERLGLCGGKCSLHIWWMAIKWNLEFLYVRVGLSTDIFQRILEFRFEEIYSSYKVKFVVSCTQ